VRIFKAKGFKPGKDGPRDADLRAAIEEIEAGLVDAQLGGELVKKRIARQGGGKRGGFRTIVAVRVGEKAFFPYCFAKNQRDDITGRELAALKRLATELMGYSEAELDKALASGALVDIDEQENRP
jgi:hypothetical protein